MAVMSEVKPKRVAKYKNKVRVLDNGSLRGVCSCGWEQPLAVLQGADLSAALVAVQVEIQRHKHFPKPKKEKK